MRRKSITPNTKRSKSWESLFPSKEIRFFFLEDLRLEYYYKIGGKKNHLKGNSFTASILIGDECVRQMESLQRSSEPSDQERFMELMSDKYTALPCRITVPTLVFWLNRELKGLPPDHPSVISKCKSFYTTGNGEYHGYFDRMFHAGIIEKKVRVGASGAIQENGRRALILWVSKNYILGTKFKELPEYLPEYLLEKEDNTVVSEPSEGSFFSGQVGKNYQYAKKEFSNENLYNKESKRSGEIEAVEMAGDSKGSTASISSKKSDFIAGKNKIGTGVLQVHFPSETEPCHAIPPEPADNFVKPDDAERLQRVSLLSENATEIAEKMTSIYKNALERGQVRGSGRVVITPETFPKWEWKRFKTRATEVLEALHREGDMIFDTRERIMRTLEIEAKRLKNPDKFILLPAMYLCVDKLPTTGEWRMIKGSLVAFHDHLMNDDQLDTPSVSKYDKEEYDEFYKKAFAGSIRKLRQIGIQSSWLLTKEQEKGRALVVKTISQCLNKDAEGKIKNSLRLYIIKSVNQSGWTVGRVLKTLEKLGSDKSSDKNSDNWLIRAFLKRDKKKKTEWAKKFAHEANHKGMELPLEILELALHHFNLLIQG